MPRHLAAVRPGDAVLVAVTRFVVTVTLLMARQCRTCGNSVATHVPCAQTTGTLSINVVAKLSTSPVYLRVGATAPIRLTHDDVTEPALALQILVTMFVVA